MSSLRSGRNRTTGSPDSGTSPNLEDVRSNGQSPRTSSTAMATRASSSDSKNGVAGKTNKVLIKIRKLSTFRVRIAVLKCITSVFVFFFFLQKMKVEASVVKGVKRPRESTAPDADEPERKNMKRPKSQVSACIHYCSYL